MRWSLGGSRFDISQWSWWLGKWKIMEWWFIIRYGSVVVFISTAILVWKVMKLLSSAGLQGSPILFYFILKKKNEKNSFWQWFWSILIHIVSVKWLDSKKGHKKQSSFENICIFISRIRYHRYFCNKLNLQKKNARCIHLLCKDIYSIHINTYMVYP